MMNSDFVTFALGAQRFTVSREALHREPNSRLCLMVRGIIPSAVNAEGCVLLDRDPRHFRKVLNFLRDGYCVMPPSLEDRLELLQEARHYQLLGLEAWLKVQCALSGAHSLTRPFACQLESAGDNSRNLRPACPSAAAHTPEWWLGQPPGGGTGSLVLSSPASGCQQALPPGPPQEAAASPWRPQPPPSADRGCKWTTKYLTNNPQLREAIQTLLELVRVPPDSTLRAGKVTISLAGECSHDQRHPSFARYQVVRVKGVAGWTYEFTAHASSSTAMWDKYGGLAEFMQDNWFVLVAVLKDQHRLLLEEAEAPAAALTRLLPNQCRRHNLVVTISPLAT